MDIQKTNIKALGSLVLGILGVTVLPLVGSLGAIALAGVAMKEIDVTPNMDGAQFAKAGRILGRAGLILGVCGALFAIVWAIASMSHLGQATLSAIFLTIL